MISVASSKSAGAAISRPPTRGSTICSTGSREKHETAPLETDAGVAQSDSKASCLVGRMLCPIAG